MTNEYLTFQGKDGELAATFDCSEPVKSLLPTAPFVFDTLSTKDGKSLSGSVVSPEPTLTFHANNTVEVLRLTKDKIIVNPDIEADEAAKKVLEILESLYTERYKQIWNEAIEAAAEVGDARDPLQDGAIRRGILELLKC